MSGGSPWSTAGTMNAAMGRDLPLGFFTLLTLHFIISYIYTVAVAHVVYRLGILSGLLGGLATGAVLYGFNYAVFHGLATQMQSPEMRVILVHFTFSLFAAAIYKGASVPRPFRGAEGLVEEATAHSIPVEERQQGDPEPHPVAR
jgi:hypothetical protein